LVLQKPVVFGALVRSLALGLIVWFALTAGCSWAGAPGTSFIVARRLWNSRWRRAVAFPSGRAGLY